jgi:hypothetical protein
MSGRRSDGNEMEPGEKFVKNLLKLVFIVAAFIVAIVLEEYSGKGWLGLLIFAVGATVAGLGHFLWKELKK